MANQHNILSFYKFVLDNMNGKLDEVISTRSTGDISLLTFGHLYTGAYIIFHEFLLTRSFLSLLDENHLQALKNEDITKLEQYSSSGNYRYAINLL